MNIQNQLQDIRIRLGKSTAVVVISDELDYLEDIRDQLSQLQGAKQSR